MGKKKENGRKTFTQGRCIRSGTKDDARRIPGEASEKREERASKRGNCGGGTVLVCIIKRAWETTKPSRTRRVNFKRRERRKKKKRKAVEEIIFTTACGR